MDDCDSYLCQNCGALFDWRLPTRPKACPDCGVRFHPDRATIVAKDQDWQAEVQRVREAVARRRGDC